MESWHLYLRGLETEKTRIPWVCACQTFNTDGLAMRCINCTCEGKGSRREAAKSRDGDDSHPVSHLENQLNLSPLHTIFLFRM